MVMSAFDESALLENARSGDEHAFAELTGGYQGELRSYCYRMLGSVQDAEDAVQNALLRAWRGLDKFEGRSSIRSWLYSIATNTTLDITRHRSRRELPADFGPAAELGAPMAEVINDPIWLEPCSEQWVGDAPASPEARY
jgi:RNA polymerase sigma-70 factor, ECF subfamily